MKALAAISEGFSRWIDSVAGTIANLLGQLASPPTAVLVEGEIGEFVFCAEHRIQETSSAGERIRIANGQIASVIPAGLATTLPGSRVHLILQPGHFLFQPLELPSRAAEFLDGVVRAQIDRLTPWSTSEAAFGWSKPSEAGTDRIMITIAATARALITPYLQAMAGVGAYSIAVFASLPEADAKTPPIKILEEKAPGMLDIDRIRKALVVVLMTAGVTAGATVGAFALIGTSLDAQQDELARKIDSVRAAVGTSRNAALGSDAATQRMLERRKHDVSPSVMVLEVLAQILPDHTYVTELRIEDNKVRLIGVTRDAASLIGLIEQSARFKGATFVAPTTRSPSDPGELFHIEAVIQPLVAPQS